MTTIHPFVESLAGRVPGAMAVILASGAFFSLAGLGAGIGIVVACRRKALFRREMAWWTWVARTNYVYVPALLLVTGGSLGAVFGAHRATRGWIEETREPLAEYARGYLADFQSSVNASMGMAEGSGTTVEELVARGMRPDALENRFAREALYRVNVALVKYAIDQADLPPEAEVPVEAIRRMDVSDLSASTTALLRRALHEAANSFFYGQYLAVLLFFAPFLVLPVIEYGAHAVYRWRNRPSAAGATESPVIG